MIESWTREGYGGAVDLDTPLPPPGKVIFTVPVL